MKLLLAEDDPILSDALIAQLQSAGYEVEHAPNGAVAQYLLDKQAFDIAVLDIGMPMLDGLSVLRQLRQSARQLPVLLLTARDALEQRVEGLQAGADDYVTKPFDLPELLARLQAILRRVRPQPAPAAIKCRQLLLDPERRRATLAGETLELSGREFDLLQLLLRQSGKVVTKEEIAKAWGAEGGEPGAGNTIEVYIHRLRRKLEGSALAILTVRGLGYLLEQEGSA